MAPISRRARYLLTALTVTLGLAIPATASAAPLAAAPASQYNSTPDCPVSLANPVCSWNVPVDATNLFTAVDYGECPYWAAEKYPALVLDELASDPLGNNWNGSTWIEHAEQEGLTTSSTPASGDLAVWQVEAGDPNGHVAYVEAVTSEGIVVSQMDGASAAPFPAMQGTTEYISTANLAYFASAYDLKFVVTGDPSTTPLSYLLQDPGTSAATTSSAPVTAAATTPKAPERKTAKRRSAKHKAAKHRTAKHKVIKHKAAKHKTAKHGAAKHTTVAHTARRAR